MREFLNMATYSTGGSAFAGAATGQVILGLLTFIFFLLFGFWGAWLKWRDSKAIRNALDSGDLKTALKLRNKERN
ncbi:holin [Salmonella phage 36]|uniref:Holin n=1 Tax=Salmonella phage 36 TaxID=1654889 RepID=A0A0N7CFL4_9CAUD|nr:holin [Salmonella phage 36]AKJ74052.1 hypothetical protein SP36_80 [Salmonella phage 36]